jgi:hypothetical protein
VACRYASRPPSVPIKTPSYKNPVQTGFSCFWGIVPKRPRNSCYFQAHPLSNGGDSPSRSGDKESQLGSVNPTKFVTLTVPFYVLFSHQTNYLEHRDESKR